MPTEEVVSLAKRAKITEPVPSTNTFLSLFRRATCESGDTSSACEKPVGGSSLTLIITLAVCIPIFLAFCVLIYLHRRTKRLQAKEDQDDRYKSMDFGMGEANAKGSKRKSKLFGGEKEGSHAKGLSMDMNLSSPYLLPTGPQQSHESLNSLARTLQNQEDPYRHVDSYLGSDAASMRSFPKGADGRASVFTARTNMSGRDSPRVAPKMNFPARQGSIPTAPLPQIPAAKEIFREEASGTPPPQYAPPSKNGFNFTDDNTAAPQVGGEHVTMPAMPEIQEPAPIAKPLGQKGVQVTERPISYESIKAAQPFVGAVAGDRDSSALPASDLYHGNVGGLGIMGANAPQSASKLAPIDTTPVSLRPGRKDSAPVVSEVPSEYSDYASYGQYDYPEEDDDRGRRASRAPAEQDPPHPAALGVPNMDNKRLSVGVRPLPPADYLESEDPEFRANRIRSFYKEYFEDGSEPRPPMPQPQKAQYYEDYDAGYGGDAPYYDPASNAFVMPYAEPVTRRAMTPPPNNRRPMPGPRQGGPRGPPGPRGMGMGSPGPGARPRAGSTMSGGRFGPMSPRPGSSASARMGGRPGPKKPVPPPSALSTLPTASKVQDEHFMILNPIDFAPPPTWKDKAAGRSQSPMGERRAYNLNVPVSSPLVSSFDDTPTLPSPHLLRKSGTFTSLDFAPPKRFKDPDSMSDAGSVRSMGSGISAMQNKALRDGAGRISRLPEDQVFTQAALGNVLKPNWGMRD
ncbi:hypothetical protein BKA67DRAFT_663664 [Truncatella angustata]|uniref:Uncharacterized protein n=1 Tax=Truncatella angustata TaxID=152316 RepID=A0A9P8RK55_9PEZI|nr:uncharacterized protein BKA67DRAFT_663664 [Truncatella angustata]KAH6645778.1 hypothetical protein BKA67DRAFT_663664 [Truncatella angustata]KAH8197625.1 hypothetical protein TruAng_008209 [Truncatella angustata]